MEEDHAELDDVLDTLLAVCCNMVLWGRLPLNSYWGAMYDILDMLHPPSTCLPSSQVLEWLGNSNVLDCVMS